MPKFEMVPVEEIKATPRISEARRRKLQEYIAYINQLTGEKGGRLVCAPNENITSIRNDLKKAAEIAGKNINIRRSGNVISFFLQKKRGGRRKKS